MSIVSNELSNKIRKICDSYGVDYIFITEGASCWSIRHDKHLMNIARIHKNTENEYDLIGKESNDLS